MIVERLMFPERVVFLPPRVQVYGQNLLVLVQGDSELVNETRQRGSILCRDRFISFCKTTKG